MKISGVSSYNNDSYLNAVSGVSGAAGVLPVQIPEKISVEEIAENQMDSYVSMISKSADSSMPIPSSTYNARGIMTMDAQLEPGSTMMVQGIDTESNLSEMGTFLEQLQNAFRANADSVLSTMEELGLTMEDLTDESSLGILATAMNAGAAERGLPIVENMDEVVDSLLSSVNVVEEVSEFAAEDIASEEAVAQGLSSSGGSGSSSESETTTEIVTINGVTYLQVTTVENGIETVTRTVLSDGAEALDAV